MRKIVLFVILSTTMVLLHAQWWTPTSSDPNSIENTNTNNVYIGDYPSGKYARFDQDGNLRFFNGAAYVVPAAGGGSYAFSAGNAGLFFNGNQGFYEFHDGNSTPSVKFHYNRGDITTRGLLNIGDSGANPVAGSIRWNGSDFEGYDGSQWRSLTKDLDADSTNERQSLILAGTYLGISYGNVVDMSGIASKWQGTSSIYYNQGKVGIGTSSPSQLLEVFSDVQDAKVRIYTEGSDKGASLLLRSNWDDAEISVHKNDNLFKIAAGNGDGLDVHIHASDVAEHLFLDHNGRVGVGTTNPTEKFSVEGKTGVYVENNTSKSTACNVEVSGHNESVAVKGFAEQGIGGFFESRKAGVIGYMHDGSFSNAQGASILPLSKTGVYGYARGGGSGTTMLSGIGVGAEVFGEVPQGTIGLFNGTAVEGIARGTMTYGTGVFGNAEGDMDVSNGIYGVENDHTTGIHFAGYFDGDVAIVGNIAWGSDEKLKKNVTPVRNALNLLQQLNAKTYFFKQEEYKRMHLPQEKQYGFIAQELQKVFPELVVQTVLPPDIRDTSQKAIDYLSVNYIGLIPILVEGINEQQQIIAQQEERIELLNQKVDDLHNRLLALEELLKKTPLDKSTETNLEIQQAEQSASLGQNIPNPFESKTIIPYIIPVGAKWATIHVGNMSGQIVHTFSNMERGRGYVELSHIDLPAGTYTYTLTIDGNHIDSKQMMLAK